MMDDETLTGEFNRNVMNYFTDTNQQRQELFRAYEYKDGHQWTADQIDQRERKGKSITTVNLAASYVRAVAGSEIMQANQLDFISMDENFDQEADIMDDAIEYAQYASSYHSERALARTDTCTCGIGAMVTYLDMTHKNFIAGKPICERIFPGFVMFDNSSRGSQVNKKARWNCYGDPVSTDTLDQYIASEKKAKMTGAADFKPFLMSFSQMQNTMRIEFIYHYFWWEYDDIYDVANPFLDQSNPIAQILAQDDDVANMMGEVLNKVQLDGQASYWSLDKETYKLLNNTFETISMLVGVEIPDLEYSKRKGKCFYRAQFARGMLIKKSRSYTQGVHALNIMTGYFDEVMGVYYGLMRPISEVQDALNISISDFQGYAKSVATGGSVYIKAAAEAIERIKKEKANEDAVTPLPALAEVIQKETTSTPQVLIQFSQLMIDLIPRTLGIPPEFMGMISSGDMTDALFGRVMKQTLNVLADFANNSASADIDQGTIFVDLVRLMADANDGQILPILSPNKKPENYIRLRKQNLAMEYAVRIIERPMTKDEKKTEFNALAQLAPQFQAAGINIMPVLAKLSNLEQELKDELVQLSTPQPAQPDPLNQALLDSQAKLQYANANKENADAQEKQQGMQTTIGKMQSEIDKNRAQTQEILAGLGTKPDAVPLLKLREQNMTHDREMLKIKNEQEHNAAKLAADGEHKKATLTASSKPTVSMQFNAEDALSKVVDTLAKSAEGVEKLAANASQTNEKTAQAMITAADAMVKAADAIAKPKRTEIIYENGRPKAAVQSPA